MPIPGKTRSRCAHAVSEVDMVILNNVVFAIAQVLAALLQIYFWIIIAAALVSWVRPDPYNPVVRALYALTEPVLYRVRKWLPFTYISGIDFSPVVVLIVIQLIENIVVRSLMQYAAGM
jgi:YggT family protein